MGDGATGGVLIVGEGDSGGGLRSISQELAAAGRQLADASGGSVVALLLGAAAGEAADALRRSGVDRVLLVEDPRLAPPSAEATATAIVAAARALDPDTILLPGTTAGRDAAPKAAARLNVPLAADCLALAHKDGALVATRAVLGGRAQTEVTLSSRPGIATIRSGSFPRAESSGEEVAVEPLEVAFAPEDFLVTVEETSAKGSGISRLDTAEVVVSGGRGLKEPANFRLVEDLAAALGGAVGATRAVVDAGWRAHDEQIGQTGRTVAPKLYIAVGISGAVQHNVGMQGSTAVVAINRDPDAPIFKVAQFGIVGDLFEILPALTAAVRAARG